MKTSEWLTAHPVPALTVTGESSLQDAARLLLDAPEGRDLFVVDTEGRIRGHLGFWHLSTLLLNQLRPTHSLRELMERITLGNVAEHMDDRVVCAQADDDLDEILSQHDLFQQQLERRVEDIPVVNEQQRLLGVIRLADVLRDAIDADH